LEFGADARWGREAEIAAGDHGFAAAVALELLGLALFGAGVDLLRRQNCAELRLAGAPVRDVVGIGDEVVGFVGVGLQIGRCGWRRRRWSNPCRDIR
jgi:hypothetical protein